MLVQVWQRNCASLIHYRLSCMVILYIYLQASSSIQDTLTRAPSLQPHLSKPIKWVLFLLGISVWLRPLFTLCHLLAKSKDQVDSHEKCRSCLSHTLCLLLYQGDWQDTIIRLRYIMSPCLPWQGTGSVLDIHLLRMIPTWSSDAGPGTDDVYLRLGTYDPARPCSTEMKVRSLSATIPTRLSDCPAKASILHHC